MLSLLLRCFIILGTTTIVKIIFLGTLFLQFTSEIEKFFFARSPESLYILHITDKFHLEIMENIVSSPSTYLFSMFYFI